MKRKKINLLASTLLGLILPLGNVWGPYLYKVKDRTLRIYRRELVIFGASVYLVCFFIGALLWMYRDETNSLIPSFYGGYKAYLLLLYYTLTIVHFLFRLFLIIKKGKNQAYSCA